MQKCIKKRLSKRFFFHFLEDLREISFRLKQELTQIYSKTLLFQCAMSTITICAIMIQLSLKSPRENPNIYIRNSFLIMAMLIEMSIFNYMGSILVESNKTLQNSLFEMNWMGQNIKFRKFLVMFQQRTQMLIEVRIGYIFVVDLTMVTSVSEFHFFLCF